MSRILTFSLLGLLLSAAVRQSCAADKREWVMLTNCQYVASKDNDSVVRLYAVSALGTLRDPAAREALEKIAKDDYDLAVRKSAETALGRLTP